MIKINPSQLRLASIVLSLLVGATVTAPVRAEAAESEATQLGSASTKAPPSTTRIGGTYEVSDIKKRPDNTFAISFQSTTPSGRYDTLYLESDHVHMGLEVGSKLRISAQILEDRGREAEIAQILIFVPKGTTHVPVWLLSKKAPHLDLKSSKYLEMHAPTSDYTVM